MNIIGERVILRAVEEKDNDMLLSLLNDPDTEALLGGWSFPSSSDAQNNWFKHLTEDKNVLRCIISVNDTAIGTAILNKIDYKNGTACVNIKLCAGEYRGKGYGTDAIKALIRYAFDELRLNCVYALALENNQASRRMLEKCGFIMEGILRDRFYKQGRYNSCVSFSILIGEYYDAKK